MDDDTMHLEPIISPDCATTKHRACSGEAWDFLADEPIGCECPCHPQPGTPVKVSVRPVERLERLAATETPGPDFWAVREPPTGSELPRGDQ